MAQPGRSPVVEGSTVLITGAAHGMGALYARRAAHQGAAAISLWDVDSAALADVADGLHNTGARVHTVEVDLSHRAAIEDGIAATRGSLGAPDIVVNNAGIVRGVPFWEHHPSRDIDLTMQVNAVAPMWLTRAFLPDMMSDRSRSKRILNIASAAGTLPNPNMSVYAASKWAMIGWSESLRLELSRTGHRHIAVTTFCPSYIATGMFAGARGPLLTPIMTPERAVGAAWNGMVAGRPIVSKPWTVKAAMAARGVLPTRVWDVVADKVFHIYSSMDHFTGRAEEHN